MNKTFFLAVPASGAWETQISSNTRERLRQERPDFFSHPNVIDLGEAPAPIYHGLAGSTDACYTLSQYISALHLSKSHLSLVCDDEASALGAIHGLLRHWPELLVIWTSPSASATPPSRSQSGLAQSMTLAWLLGVPEERPWWLKRLLSPRQLIYLGLRDLTSYERTLVDELDVTCLPAGEDTLPPPLYALEQELQQRDPQGKRPIAVVYRSGTLRLEEQQRLSELMKERNFVASILSSQRPEDWSDAFAMISTNRESQVQERMGAGLWSELRSFF